MGKWRQDEVAAMSKRDFAAEAVHAAWDAHTAALALGDDIQIRRTFIGTLKAERDLEQNSLDHCTQEPTRELYRQTIAEYSYRIEDEEKALAKALADLV